LDSHEYCDCDLIHIQIFYHNTGVSGFCEDEPYADLDIDEVDINFENYEELFGYTLTHSEHLLENGGIDSLFMRQDTSTADSNCRGGPVEVCFLCNVFSIS